MNQEREEELCVRLTYRRAGTNSDEDPVILLGRLLDEDETFIKFETARRKYTISKKLVLFIEQTDEPFKQEVWR